LREQPDLPDRPSHREELRVPEPHGHLRERLAATLTPAVNPRAARREKVRA